MSQSIIIDFDGVLAHYKPGMAIRDEQGDPIEGAVEAMVAFKKRGYTLIIHTSRPITKKLRKWFEYWDCPYDYIVPTPDGIIFIDDRAFTFKGSWEGIVEEVESFKPWWQTK